MCIRDRLQTGLAGTLSESLHTAVVNETAAVIDHFGNALLKALLGDVLANLLGSINVAAVSVEIFVHAGSAGQGHALLIIDDPVSYTHLDVYKRQRP